LQLQQTTKELQYKLASKQICKFSIFVWKNLTRL
jgi:hypothetical protein